MNTAEIDDFGRRLDTFSNNLQKFVQQIKQVQDQMQQAFKDLGLNHNQTQDAAQTDTQINSMVSNQLDHNQTENAAQSNMQQSIIHPVDETDPAVPDAPNPPDDTQNNAMQAKAAMDLINSINIPDLLDVTPKQTTVQPKSKPKPVVAQTEIDKPAIANKSAIEASNNVDINNILNTVLEQKNSQKEL